MRILLCLVSDQHVPNLLSVHHFQPDWLVLIVSLAMQKKRTAEHFLDALKLGGLDYTSRCDIQPLEAEDSLDAVGRALRSAFGRHADADWIVNLSGGTKPMSIAAYEFFKAVGARLVYINVPRPNEILGLDGHAAERCTYRPSVKEFLAGYGFEFRKTDHDIHQAEERARRTWSCAREIAATCPAKGILHFGDLGDPENKKQWDDARKKGLDARPHHWNAIPPNVSQAICRAFGLCEDNQKPCGRLNKYAVEFLTGGWLEVFLWGLLDKHKEALKIWDVHLGVQPGKIGVETTSEFDVAFMRHYRLAVVECKSGTQTHDPGADALHKLEAVVRQFRALGVNSYLVTTSGSVLDKNGNLKDSVRNRAAVYGSRVIGQPGLRRLAENPDSVETVRELFFAPQET